MKAQELMVGDWVNDGGENAIVTSLTCVGIIETTRRISNIEVVEPVPLTPEILEKNGFVYGKNYGESVLNDWQVLCDCTVIAARNERGWLIDIQCRYVHELQHALRLCGIEKEIVL